jgi:hypothetical protein
MRINHGRAENALLASTHEALGLLAKIAATFAGGIVIGAAWYLCVGLRAGVM